MLFSRLFVPFAPIGLVGFYVFFVFQGFFLFVFLIVSDGDENNGLDEGENRTDQAQKPSRMPKTGEKNAQRYVEHNGENLHENGQFDPSPFAEGEKGDRRVRTEEKNDHRKEGQPTVFDPEYQK